MSGKYTTPEDEYKKTKKLKKEDIQILQEWINKQPHLPKINELKIIAFLNSRYFKIQPTKECIEKFYTIKAHWPEFVENRNILSPEYQKILKSVIAAVLPIRTKENYEVIYVRYMYPDINNFSYIHFTRVFDMIAMAWYRKYGISKGQVLLFDTEGITFSHCLKCHPVLVKKHLYYCQETLPIRLKGIHVLNISPVADTLLSIAKPFMNSKTTNMIHLHQKIDTVYDFVPKEALPNEYGGKAGTFKELQENLIALMKENADYLKEDGLEMVDESKRLEKSNNLDDIFGTDGTFKKLEID